VKNSIQKDHRRGENKHLFTLKIIIVYKYKTYFGTKKEKKAILKRKEVARNQHKLISDNFFLKLFHCSKSVFTA
jgi:hypothetical protein